jgi:hypothetical protein
MKQISIYMAVIAMLVLSCNTSNRGDKGETAVVQDIAMAESAGKTDDQQVAAPDKIVTPAKNKIETTHEDWDKKIIKTAEVTLELKDYAQYDQTIIRD